MSALWALAGDRRAEPPPQASDTPGSHPPGPDRRLGGLPELEEAQACTPLPYWCWGLGGRLCHPRLGTPGPGCGLVVGDKGEMRWWSALGRDLLRGGGRCKDLGSQPECDRRGALRGRLEGLGQGGWAGPQGPLGPGGQQGACSEWGGRCARVLSRGRSGLASSKWRRRPCVEGAWTLTGQRPQWPGRAGGGPTRLAATGSEPQLDSTHCERKASRLRRWVSFRDRGGLQGGSDGPGGAQRGRAPAPPRPPGALAAGGAAKPSPALPGEDTEQDRHGRRTRQSLGADGGLRPPLGVLLRGGRGPLL